MVPCHNGAEVVTRQLDALTAQKAPLDFEIVVVNNRSDDSTPGVVLRYAESDQRVRLVEAPDRPGVNYARNVGVRSARSECIVICDSDDVVHDGWLDAYAEAFRDGAEIVGGPLRYVDRQGNELRKVTEPFRYFGPLAWPAGANCGFTRAVYDDLSGFDEGYRGGGDETDFFWRAQLQGHDLVFVEHAWIDYVQRPNTCATAKQHYRFGVSEVKLFRSFGSSHVNKPSLVRTVPAIASGALNLAVATLLRKSTYTGASRLGRNVGRLRALVALPRGSR